MTDQASGPAAALLADNSATATTTAAAAQATTATTTTPPADPAATAAAATAQAATTTPPADTGDPWFTKAGIEDKETTDWLGAKNFPDQKAQIEAHRHLEKLLGGSERIILPKDASDQAGWDKVWNRLGRPEKPDGYALDKVDGADATFTKHMGEAFHKAGVPASMAKSLVEAYQGFGKTMADQALAQAASKSDADMNALKSEWGATYDERIEAGRRVVARDGLSNEDLTALESVWGTGKMLKYFASRGAEVMEDKAPRDTLTPSFTMTPDAAKAQIASKMADPQWIKQYTHEDPKIRGPAITEMERLQVMAAGQRP